MQPCEIGNMQDLISTKSGSLRGESLLMMKDEVQRRRSRSGLGVGTGAGGLEEGQDH